MADCARVSLLRSRDPEVVLGRGADAVVVVAEEVLVVVGGDDPSLAVQAGIGLRHADRLDDLLDLALDRPFGVLDQGGIKEPLAHELLGKGRRTAPVTLERVEGRRAQGHRVEARVRPEGLVLDRGQGVKQSRRDLVEGDDFAALGAEAGQLDLPGTVPDDRLLVEGDVLERGRLGQVPSIERVRGDGADEGDTGDGQKGGEEEEGEGDRSCARHSSAAPAAAISAARTAALEARLHARGYVTILGRLALPASWTHGQTAARTPSALDAWAVTFVPSVRSAADVPRPRPPLGAWLARLAAGKHRRPRGPTRAWPDQRLRRLRSDRPIASRGSPRAGLPADAPPARRGTTGRPHRWRHGHDRRPVGQERRAESHRRCHARREQGPLPRSTRPLHRLFGRVGGGGDARQSSVAGRLHAARVPARCRQALHDPLHAGQGVRAGCG